MTRSQIASAVILSAVCLALCSSAPARAQKSAWRAEAALLLPPDATGLLGFDLAAARSSALYRRIESNLREEQRTQLDEFAAAAGFDPRHDLAGVLAATWGRPGLARQPFLAVLGGRFALTDEARAMLDVFAPPSGEHRGIAIHALPAKDAEQGDPPAYFAILDERTALLGVHDAVVAGVERFFSGGASMHDNQALTARAEQAAAAGQIWFVSDQPGELIEAAPDDIGRRHARIFNILRSIRETVFTVDVVDGLDLDWSALLGSPGDAQTLADALHGLLALARITVPPENSEALRLLERLEVGSEAERVGLGLRLTAFELDRAPRRRRGARRSEKRAPIDTRRRPPRLVDGGVARMVR